MSSTKYKPFAALLTLALVAGSLSAQGKAIDAAAFDAIVAKGPIAGDATIAASAWATKIKKAGTLRLGATQTSNLFSLRNEVDGKLRGFDAGIAQLITRYILGDSAKYSFAQVTSSTREQVLINDQVDMVLATYSITPARAEKISFAGPYYTSQAGVLVKTGNKTIARRRVRPMPCAPWTPGHPMPVRRPRRRPPCTATTNTTWCPSVSSSRRCSAGLSI